MLTSDCYEVRAMRYLCHCIPSRYSQQVRSWFDKEDYMSYLRSSVSPGDYSCATAFSLDYCIMSFLRKWIGFDALVDKKAVALAGFWAAEAQCETTNRRLLSPCLENRDVDAILLLAQRKVAEIMGDFKFSHIERLCRWSNGATFDLRRGTSVAQKHNAVASVTPYCMPYFQHLVWSDPHWSSVKYSIDVSGPISVPLDKQVKLVKGGRFMTVPKDALKDRGIDPQPTGNCFLQQGAGRYLRYRLKRFGVDLSDQSRNKGLASVAQSKQLSTLDLASASDTMSTALVAALVPEPWFMFLDAIRSYYTRVGGRWIKLHKFSAMGNAFTFELESMIFYALAVSTAKHYGVCSSDISVYGDDIIVPHQIYSSLVNVLEHCGFSVNAQKSFTAGSRFFESCGGHYFDGVDVTPCYQKSLCSDGAELIRLHNRLCRWVARIGNPVDLSPLLARLVTSFKESSDGYLPRIPFGSDGDDGFLSDPSSLGHYDPNHGYLCDLWLAVPRFRYERRVKALLAYKLRYPSFSSPHPKGWAWLTSSDSNVSYCASKGWRHPGSSVS